MYRLMLNLYLLLLLGVEAAVQCGRYPVGYLAQATNWE